MLLYVVTKEKILNFDKIYQKYIKLVLKVANNILDDTHSAQDVAQETFVKVYNTMGKFQTEDQLKAWIIVLTKNTAIDFYRKNSKEKKLNYLFLDDSVISQTLLDIKKSPAEAYIFQETFQRVLEEIFKMDPKYKEVILLKEYFGFTTEEICKLLNISIDNYRVRLHRAKKLIVQKLSEKDIIEGSNI